MMGLRLRDCRGGKRRVLIRIRGCLRFFDISVGIFSFAMLYTALNRQNGIEDPFVCCMWRSWRSAGWLRGWAGSGIHIWIYGYQTRTLRRSKLEYTIATHHSKSSVPSASYVRKYTLSIRFIIDIIRADLSTHLPLRFGQFRWISDWNAQLFFLDLSDWASEPSACPEEPRSECPKSYDTHSDGGIVESLVVDGVHARKAEDDADEDDVEGGHERDGAGGEAEVEWSFVKVAWVD